MFTKLQKSIKRFFTNKSGFSLVELIVVIAIMAVMAAVLAPSLLGYVEKSRMQKDASIMSEVVNSMKLSLADQEIYDELLQASVKDNYSCYVDGNTKTNTRQNMQIIKTPEYWLYNDSARLLDETPYQPAGNMRGVTITFKPNGQYKYVIANGIMNQIGDVSTSKGNFAGKTLKDSMFENTYNRLRSTIGDELTVSSQTYRNSDYTIFISMGTTGGDQADKQDAIQVWGQYNGTNLSEVATPIAGAQQDAGRYTAANGEEFNLGQPLPEPQKGDVYVCGEYTYGYKVYFCVTHNNWQGKCGCTFKDECPGWSVRVLDDTKETYGLILNEINGYPILNMRYTFYNCLNFKDASNIQIPNSVLSIQGAFARCKNLTTAPTLPEGISNLHMSFAQCRNLEVAPALPTTAFNINTMFSGCTKLNTPPVIPENVTYMSFAFEGCTSLSGSITVNTNKATHYYGNFIYQTQITEILGTCSDELKASLLATK